MSKVEFKLTQGKFDAVVTHVDGDNYCAEVIRNDIPVFSPKFQDDIHYSEMGLVVEDGELADYEGVTALPKIVLDLLQTMNIKVNRMFYQEACDIG